MLTAIPKVWSKQAIEDRGVLVVSTPTINKIDTRLNSGELLIQINILSDTHRLLSQQVGLLSSSLKNQSISDPASGMSVVDLGYKLELENKYRISILKEIVVRYGVGVKSTSWFKGFREARLGKLVREKSSHEGMVGVYEQALVEFNQQQQKPASGVEYSGGNNAGTTVNAPQYGEDVINQLLDLGSRMSDPEYRKSLLQEKINISTKLQAVNTEIDFYTGSADVESGVFDISVDEITKLLAASFEELKSIHSALVVIIGVSNLSQLDDSGELFDLVGVIKKNVSGNLTKAVVLKALLAFILGCMVGTVVVFFRRLIEPVKTTG